jgi:hypothetical protein
MVEARVPLKSAQELLGHSRPDILLKFYAHVLDERADAAAETLSGQRAAGPVPRRLPRQLIDDRLSAYWQRSGS